MSRARSPSEAIVVFVRHPRPGSVKTRLAETLGARLAARVYRRVARHVVNTALDAANRQRPVYVCVDPPERTADAPAWLNHGPSFKPQRAGDLGRRMQAAFDEAFEAGHERVVLIGSDCPSIEPGDLDEAFEALGAARCVLGPARDGGYWLVGLSDPRPGPFDGVPWGTPAVLDETRQRLREAGIEWRELRELGDLDTADDLLALSEPLPRELRAALGVLAGPGAAAGRGPQGGDPA